MGRIICLSVGIIIIYNVLAQHTTDFDWNNYQIWDNQTRYSKTYVVNQQHPEASDNNPGTFDKPFLTINKAAQLAKAGERILIHRGVYREMIQPKYGGKSNSKMISYESVPGHKVIIKGSRIINTRWIQRNVYTDTLGDTSLTYTWSRKLWFTTIPDTIFEIGYYPLQLHNIQPDEYRHMPWARLTKDLSPYNASRGILFQNGKRMVQLNNYGDLTRLPGSFWVDNDGKSIHIHPFGSKNPNNDLFELGVQSHLFKPQEVGLAYIQIRGLIFEHCANGFLRTGTGAITALAGHHWIIEDNIIRHINSSGLEFGLVPYERTDPNSQNKLMQWDEISGGMLVRNNRVYDCGTAGMRSLVVHNAIIENNTIWDCGWQDAEHYWECSGIKILLARRTLVKGNHIYNIQGGNGIWVDWDNQYSRVTANIVHDIQNIQGGIFMEASHRPNMIDNNIIWNIDGNGIYGNESDSMIIAHNLIANTTGNLFIAELKTARKQDGRALTVKHNRIFNNIFIDGKAPVKFGDNDNYSDYNLYVSTKQPYNIDMVALQNSGFELNSKEMQAFVKFNRDVLFVLWLSKDDIPEVPVFKEVDIDFYGKQRYGKTTIPGPFSTLSKFEKKLLLETDIK